MAEKRSICRTAKQMRERAEHIVTNRREGDVCNRGECFYPTVPELAADVLVLLSALDAIAFNASSWHAREDGKARALAVIRTWADDPTSVPAGLGLRS